MKNKKTAIGEPRKIVPFKLPRKSKGAYRRKGVDKPDQRKKSRGRKTTELKAKRDFEKESGAQKEEKKERAGKWGKRGAPGSLKRIQYLVSLACDARDLRLRNLPHYS